MGTDDGLARFDGYQFEVYRHEPDKPNSLNNNVVRALHSDPNDNIWIGTEGGGINILNPRTGRIFPLNLSDSSGKSLIFNKISSICSDNEQNFWIGTNGGGLVKISGFQKIKNQSDSLSYHLGLSSIQINRDNSSIKDDKIWNIYQDQSKNIWIGTHEDGAYLMKSGTGNIQTVPINLDGKKISSIKSFYEDSKGNFWIGTEKNGIFIKEKGKNDFKPFMLPELKGNFQQRELNITGYWEDRQGNLWIGTLGRGLFVLNAKNGEIAHYEDDPSDPYSLNGNSVYTLFEDHSGNIWLGMYSGEGLNKTNPDQQYFEHFRYDPALQKGLSGKMVKSILRDDEGNLWIGLFNGGLNVLPKNESRFKYYTAGEGQALNHNHVQVIYQARDKKVWIGTDGGGINIFDPKTKSFESLHHEPGNPNSLSKNEVWAIVEDREGNFWVGTANGGGLNKIDRKTKKITHFIHQPNNPQSLLYNDIRSLMLDSKNNLWIGTYGGGLSKLDLDNGTFKHYQKSQNGKAGISHGMITALMEDKTGYIWIGTFGGGLNRLNPLDESIVVFREKDGLPSDIIKAVLEDNSGQLWISTVNGLSSMDKVNLTFKNYTEEDGLQSDEFNLGAAFKDPDGRLYFGGTNGFNAFYPERIVPNPLPKAPIITQLKVLNEIVVPEKPILEKILIDNNISYVNELRLSHYHNNFEFTFSALEYSSQEKIRFAYMLDGYDKDWAITDSKRRFANYANLPPGNYTLKIRAFFENDPGYSEITNLSISILPPWYKTNLAYLIYFLLFIALLYGVKSLVSWRIKLRNDLRFERLEHQKHEEINQLKLRFFTNISHELRTPLMLIKAPLEQLVNRKDLPEPIKKQLDSINTNAGRLIRLINQLLDFRKQESGHLKLAVRQVDIRVFMDEIFKSFEVVALQKQIDFKLEIAPDSPQLMWFDPEQMEKIMFNLIYNAFKFTPENGKIIIKVRSVDFVPRGEDTAIPGLSIAIEDNGKGILPEHQTLIFERFFQIHQKGNYEQAGTGIGLALSKNLVDFHKGEIKVESTPHERTVFTVLLRQGFEHYDKHELVNQEIQDLERSWISQELDQYKIEKKQSQVLEPQKIQLKNTQTKRVLIVEDNPDLLKLLVGVLQESFTVLTAQNGKEGIKAVMEEKPDFVISDVMMPVMDGIEFCGRIKRNIESSHIPVILLTAKSSHTHQLEGYESGADDYITKPFNLDLLVLKIKNLLESREKLQRQFKKSPDLEPSRIQVTSADEKLLQDAIAAIEKNIDNNDFNVNELVREIGLSRTLVFEKFKALIGQTPNDFIQTIRLKRAAQLILESDLKVAEIGYMVGFNNPKYFSKCFQKQFGVIPSKYKSVGV